ncbi:MAG: QueT transporter family protein [Clostridiales bacterium]|nr:QueT transporter family protein [Clostridiales bacterium]
MRKVTTRELTLGAMVAALYVLLSYLSGLFGLAYGPVQFRFAEALCVLPFLFPTAVPGLALGCLITNLLSPYGPLDVVFGTLATLLAALWTARVPNRWLAPLPPVLCNAVIVGAVIAWASTDSAGAFRAAYVYNAGLLALEELGACYVLGMLLLYTLPRIKFFQPMMRAGRL